MQTPARNFAARAGRWSARHRKIAIFGWLAFVAIAAIGGGAAGLNTFVWQENGPGEAGRADKAMFDHFPRHAEETVLVQSRGDATVRDAAFRSVAMVGSITVLPALLSKLGDRVDKGRIPLLRRLRSKDGESRVWGAILDRVLARPKTSALIATALLLAMAFPALSLKTGVPGTDSLPRDLAVMQTFDRIEAAFPGGPMPAVVAIKAADVTSPAVSAAIARLREDALASGQVREPIALDVSPDERVARLALPIVGDGSDARSEQALTTLRSELIPQTIGRTRGAEAFVTGQTAQSRDFNDLMKGNAPIVFAFVLSMAFLLLLFTFRSIVIPIKAIVLNLLSVGAAYGVLVFFFQQGHGEDLLGFESTGAITSAAIVMVAVFAIFATLRAVEFKQMGVGLAVAVLVDATLVRAVLLPAAMKLLGDWNWYLPRRLRRIPRIVHEPALDTH